MSDITPADVQVIPGTGLEWRDYPRLVFTAPYFATVPLAEIFEPAIKEAAELVIPGLVAPIVDASATAAVQRLAVQRGGDTMTGPLFFTDPLPTQDNEAASKLYVDMMMATGGIPEVPILPANTAWARELGAWVPLPDVGNMDLFLPLEGGTMTGPINMAASPITNLAPVPMGPNDATPRTWVLAQIASQSLYQGTWSAQTNVPDLTSGALRQNNFAWIVVTADPETPVTITQAIPGLVGVTVWNGDTILYSVVAGQFQVVHSGGLSVAEAQTMFLPLTGGTMTGPLLLSGPPVADLEAASRLWVLEQLTVAGYVPEAPQDGVLYGRYNGTWQDISHAPVFSLYLPLIGGTLSGPLSLYGNAGSALQAVPLQQLNSSIASAISAAGFLPLTGGTMTGPLILQANATQPLGAVTLQQMQGAFLPIAGGTLTGTVNQATPALPAAAIATINVHEVQVPIGGHYAFNAWWNPTSSSWIYNATGTAALLGIPSTTGALTCNMAVSGSTGAVVGFQPVWTVQPGGTFIISNATGGIGGGAASGAADTLNIWRTPGGDGGIIGLTGPTHPTNPNQTLVYAGPATGRLVWTFDGAGGLTCPGQVSVGGVLTATHGVWLGGQVMLARDVVSNWDIMRDGAAGIRYFRWRTDGWNDLWRESDGWRAWFAPTGQLMALDGGGNLSAAGTITTASTMSANNYWITALGNWISAFINQPVTTAAWPTFNGVNCNAVNCTGLVSAGTFSGGWTNGGHTITQLWGVNGLSMWVDNQLLGQAIFTSNLRSLSVTSDNVYLAGLMTGNQQPLWQIIAWSDARLKQDIKPTKVDALSVLNRLRLVEWNFRDDARAFSGPRMHEQIGFTAQDVEAVAPDAVSWVELQKGATAPATIDDRRVGVVSQLGLVPYCVRAIQQMSARLSALEKAHG